jgi:hypothetical protein
MIDLKEMPIDEYNRHLLPESKSTQMGNPAWMIANMLCYGHVAACFLSKRFYILDTCAIFLRLFHSAFILFHSAFIWQRAFVQVFLRAGKCFIIALLFKFF